MQRSRRGDDGTLSASEGSKKVAQISAYYKDLLELVRDEISAGKANTGEGLMGVLQLADLMHGGAYAVPINQRPFFMVNPSDSPYYAADLSNVTGNNFINDIIGFFTGGPTGTQWASEVLEDANVPHVLPKLLSDEAYAQVKILFSQAGTTLLFNQTAAGLKTLVEAATAALEPFTDEPVTAAERTAQLEAGDFAQNAAAGTS